MREETADADGHNVAIAVLLVSCVVFSSFFLSLFYPKWNVDVATALFTGIMAIAAMGAAYFAYTAWKTQNESLEKQKEQLEQEKKNTAMTQVAEYIESITTGDLAQDRDTLEVWHRKSRRNGEFADDARRAYFNLLWALQRSAALELHIKEIDEPLRDVLKTQLDLVVGNVNTATEKGAKKWDASSSWSAACTAINALRKIKDSKGNPLMSVKELKTNSRGLRLCSRHIKMKIRKTSETCNCCFGADVDSASEDASVQWKIDCGKSESEKLNLDCSAPESDEKKTSDK